SRCWWVVRRTQLTCSQLDCFGGSWTSSQSVNGACPRLLRSPTLLTGASTSARSSSRRSLSLGYLQLVVLAFAFFPSRRPLGGATRRWDVSKPARRSPCTTSAAGHSTSRYCGRRKTASLFSGPRRVSSDSAVSTSTLPCSDT